jgi:hypothetical protein
MDDSPSDSGFVWGSGGVCGAVLGGGVRGHGLSLGSHRLPDGQYPSAGRGQVWRRTPELNRAFPAGCCRADVQAVVQAVAARSGAVNRFALAIGALPMLETARIGGDAGSL